MDKNSYMIQIRGYIPEMKKLEFMGENTADYYFGNGYIKFNGTESELDNLLRTMSKDETYFKVIGIFDDSSFKTLKAL